MDTQTAENRVTYYELYQQTPRDTPYRLHQALWRLFPDESERPFQYRFDSVGDKYLVLIRLADDALMGDGKAGAHLVPMGADIAPGTNYLFDIRLVPEIRKGNTVIDTPTDADAAAWFRKKSEQHGFTVNRIDNAASQALVFRGKRGRRITLNDTLISGELCITDANRFRDAMLKGIGRHKGFGFGLLNIHAS